MKNDFSCWKKCAFKTYLHSKTWKAMVNQTLLVIW